MIDGPLYFGCHMRVGHFLWLPGMRQTRARDETFSRTLETRFDGTLCPPGIGQKQGVAALHVLFAHRPSPDCVTALAFWDRSVDDRGGSNSLFLLPGRMAFPDMLDAARKAFPEVFARLRFEVVRHGEAV